MKSTIRIDFKFLYAVVISFVFYIFGLYALVGKFSWAHGFTAFFAILAVGGQLFGRTNPLGQVDSRFFPLVAYTVLQTMAILMAQPSMAGTLLVKVFQWLLYFGVIMFFNPALFVWQTQLRVLRAAVVLATGYLILQQLVAMFMGIYLAPGITIFPYVRPELKEVYLAAGGSGWVYRPRSFFSEPALYCQFALPALCIELFGNRHEKIKDYKYAFLLVVGIIISKSGTGFWGLAFIVGIYLLYELRRSKKSFYRMLVAIYVGIPVVMMFLLRNRSFQVMFNRFFEGGSLAQNLSSEIRFQILFNLDWLDMDTPMDYLFGHGFSMDGFGNDILYLGGLLRHFYCFGLIGMIILAILLIQLFCQGTAMQKMLVLLLVLLSTGSNPLHNEDVLIFFAYAAAPMLQRQRGSMTGRTEYCSERPAKQKSSRNFRFLGTRKR